jgi:hypothetical protein
MLYQRGATSHIRKWITNEMIVSSNYTSKCKYLGHFFVYELLIYILLPFLPLNHNADKSVMWVCYHNFKNKGCVFRSRSLGKKVRIFI